MVMFTVGIYGHAQRRRSKSMGDSAADNETNSGQSTPAEPGRLLRLDREGSYTVRAGDLILVALDQHPPDGRDFPNGYLKVIPKGKGLSANSYVVTATPAIPSGNGDEIQAYIPVESEGEATLTVVSYFGSSLEESGTLEYEIKITRRED
jgi:hypothetical protein